MKPDTANSLRENAYADGRVGELTGAFAVIGGDALAATSGRKSTRLDMLALQARLVEQLKEQAYGINRHDNGAMNRYYNHYREEFRTSQRHSSKAELLKRVRRANLVYVGDFHTLPQAQALVARLLVEVAEERPKIILALEMLDARHQRYVERYLDGDLDEDGFLAAIEYEQRWGFPWSSYRPLFDLARSTRGGVGTGATAGNGKGVESHSGWPTGLGNGELTGGGNGSSRPGRNGSASSSDSQGRGVVAWPAPEIRIVGLNCDAPPGAEGLPVRDAFAADLLAALATTHPDHLIVTVYGDLHLARSHVPGQVRERLSARGVSAREVVIYQNSETVYWRLARERMEHRVEVVKLGRDRFCVMTASPMAKFQSYVDWQRQRDEALDLSGYEPDVLSSEGLTESITGYAETIADFFDLDLPDAASLSVYVAGAGELGWVDSQAMRRAYTARERAELRALIPSQRGGFLARAGVVYLCERSLHVAAEQAGRFLRASTATATDGGAAKSLWPRTREAFYDRVLELAAAYVGSKLIDHKRTCDKLPDYLSFLVGNAGRKLTGRDAEYRALARLVVRHKELESRYLARPEGQRRRFVMRSIERLEPATNVALTEALGYLLGDALYRGLVEEAIPREVVHGLFVGAHAIDAARPTPGEAQRRYVTLIEQTRNIRDKFKARAEQI